jgi:hypothetical protein
MNEHLFENHRFIERDYWYKQALKNSTYLLPSQIDKLLDHPSYHWNDYTFRFYWDGSVTIIDNINNQVVPPSALTGASLDYYVRKKIKYIRTHIFEKQEMESA